MVLDEQMQLTKQFFESHHIKLSPIWLEKCVEWVREENPNSTQKEINFQVFEQWLLLDLCDVEVATLPPITNEKQVLSGIYCLQMQSIVDISLPKLAQLNKIRYKNPLKTETYEEANPAGKRMLLLTLTDGVQEVRAMEYEQIPHINVHLQPGVKIKILGPVTVRKGRIMLKKENIKVLGGSVEELIIPNSSENVLAKALNLPLSDTLPVIDERLKTDQSLTHNRDNSINNLQNSNNIVTQNNRTTSTNYNQSTLTNYIQNNVNRNQTTTNHSNYNKPSSSYHNSKPSTSNSNENSSGNTRFDFPDEDDDLLLNVPLDFEEPNTVTAKAGSSNRNPTPDMFDDEIPAENWDSFDFRDAEESVKNTNTVETSRISDSATKLNKIQSDSSMKSNKTPVSSTKLNKTSPSTNNMGNLRLICELEDLRNKVTKGKFKVHARYNAILQKLKANNDRWEIRIKIEDDTGEVEAVMSSELISELVGYCPEAINALKKNIANNDTLVVNTIMKALTQFSQKLTSIDCLMDVLIEKGKDFCITKLYDKL